MKITLITVCYNSESTIQDTLESVLKQTYKNYEYLIIDGKSKDNTLKIVKSYEDKFNKRLKYISEPDEGLYDAMNKGIKMATGDIIGIINSDDVLASYDVLETIVKTFQKSKCDATYSKLEIKDENLDKVIRVFDPKKGNYKFGWYPPHPTLYVKTEVYKKHGLYNQKFRIAADYDFMLRVMKDQSLKIQYINKVLVYMRSGGLSTNGFKGYYKSLKESYTVLKVNKIKLPFFVNGLRAINIFLQALKAKTKNNKSRK
ncbi:MAG TPA: glycosyltransferase [Candidatus Scybalousia intestinigallinarum]|nr:glycosyltransferase [Candidatus Scybalousia intestinigallinarum]